MEKENDFSAGLIGQAIPTVDETGPRLNTGIPRIPNVWENAEVYAAKERTHRSRLEFALVLARESGKLFQQSMEAVNPKFSDQLRANADREFVRAMKIVDEVVGSGTQVTQEPADATRRSAAQE